MNAVHQLLTDQIDIWTAAEAEKKSGRGRSSSNGASVYGIKKLRELILELAVRGKLVPQDANDEPASELLKRIQVERAKLVAEGKIKKGKPLLPITEEEEPFDLPDNWEWVRFGEVCSYIQRGKGPAYVDNSDFLVISQKCVRWAGLDLSQARYIDPESLIKYEEIRKLCEGDILWNSTGTGTIGRACFVPPLDVNKILLADSHVTVVRPVAILSIFLWRWIQSPSVQSNIEGAASGTTNQIELNTSTVISHSLPLPSLAEQHRIVAKVDELMALCDQLETQHINATEAHEKLVNHLLATLTQAQSADDFSANWQRIAAHFDTLFITESSIDVLKQALLQLAVMGKLVPQDAKDEPASELLKRIQAEKAKLIAEGKIKKGKPLLPITEDEKPFELPEGWQLIRLNELLNKIGAGSTPLGGKQVYVNEGIPFLRSQNVWNEALKLDDVAFITQETHHKMSGTHVCAGDLLFNITGASIGRCAIVPDSFKTGNVSQHVTIVRPISIDILLYLHLVLISRHVQKTVMDVQVGVSREGLSIGKLGQFIIPIPPLLEQDRIVTKVDELMALCDQLKTRITEANQLQQKLADGVVEQAVA